MPRATQLFLLLGLLGLLDLLGLLGGCSLDLARLRGDLDAATSDAPGLDAPLSDAPGHDAPADGGAALIDPVLAMDLVGTPSDLIVGPDPDGARIVVDFGSSTLHTATFRGSACVFAGASIVDVAGTWRGATALMDVRGSTDLDILADSGDGSASVLERGAGNAFEPSAPVTLGTGGVLVALGVGNLDGDALPDLVAVERSRFAVPLVRVGGVFSAESGISTGSGTHVAALVSDVDGMDADDLVTLVDDGGTVFLEIQRNLGTRMPLTFQTVTSTPLGSGAAALAVGASSGSGQRPIAAVVGEQLWMGLLTDASGAPAISTFGPFALEAGTTDVVIAEADGDSDEDIVTISPRMGGTGLLTLSRWDGGGSVVAHTSIVLPAVPTELASFDVDGDGTAELFVLTEGGLLVYSLRCPP